MTSELSGNIVPKGPLWAWNHQSGLCERPQRVWIKAGKSFQINQTPSALSCWDDCRQLLTQGWWAMCFLMVSSTFMILPHNLNKPPILPLNSPRHLILQLLHRHTYYSSHHPLFTSFLRSSVCEIQWPRDPASTFTFIVYVILFTSPLFAYSNSSIFFVFLITL